VSVTLQKTDILIITPKSQGTNLTMHSTSSLTTLILAITTALAASETTVHNACSFDLWYAPVDSTAPINMTRIPPGGYVMQDEWFDGNTGTTLKITKTEKGLWTGGPVLNFGYTLTSSELYYSLATINGYDFTGEKITLAADKDGATEIVWDGSPGSTTPAHVFGDTDLTLTICA
jgi:hypothetical protein